METAASKRKSPSRPVAAQGSKKKNRADAATQQSKAEVTAVRVKANVVHVRKQKQDSSRSSSDAEEPEREVPAVAAKPPPMVISPNTKDAAASSGTRFLEILHTLAKYGLADLLGDNLPKSLSVHLTSSLSEKNLSDHTRAERCRLCATELGTTFIKLAQVLSTRQDLVGPVIAEELSKLQSDTPPDAPGIVRGTMETELGAVPEELFSSFDYNAMASASIGQVHAATTLEGEEVVVKVQHAGIEQVIVNDFKILARLAEIADKYSAEARLYRPQSLVDNFRRDLLRELDFGRECKSLSKFEENFKEDPLVIIPKPYPELSSKRVMTMSRVSGTSVKHTAELEAAGHDLKDIAERGANIFIKMIFEHRFYHADPHPGNLFVQEDGSICLLDCGMTGRLDDKLRGQIEELLSAAVNNDSERLTDAVLRLATAPKKFDRTAFEVDVSEFLDEYGDTNIDDWDFTAVVNDLTGIIRRYRIQLPANVSLLLRMLCELEGTAGLLNPSFSMNGLLEPYLQDSVKRKFDPKLLAKRIMRNAGEWERIVDRAPRDLSELMDSARKGELAVHLEHENLDSIINRLIYGVLTASLILGSSQLWSREIEPLFYGQSVPGVICGIAAFILSVRLLRSIERFGGLGISEEEL